MSRNIDQDVQRPAKQFQHRTPCHDPDHSKYSRKHYKRVTSIIKPPYELKIQCALCIRE